MTYQHRPLSTILAPAADPAPKASSDDKPPAEPKTEPQVDDSLPEKYRGKTAAEIADMHINAERELGRVRNEVGTYRGLVNDLTSLTRTAPEPKPAQEKLEVSGDDLIVDPVGTVRKIVKQDFDELQTKQDADVAQRQFETEGRALMTAYPDLDDVVMTDEFQKFATRTPSRQADFTTAAQGTGLDQVRAARRLMEDYTDFQSATKPAATPQEQQPSPTDVARKAATEGGGTAGAVSTKPQLHETDVIALINSDPAKYRSPSFQRELTEAIKEGRFVKQS